MSAGRFFGGLAHVDATASLDAILSISDDDFPRLKSVVNDCRGLVQKPDLEGTPLDQSVLPNHESVRSVGSLLNCGDWNCNNISADVNLDTNVYKRPRPQCFV